MSYTEDTAQDIAMLALAEAEASGSPKIVDQIADMMGASSQSLQEAYLTAIRVRRSEARAREMLAAAAAQREAKPATAEPPIKKPDPAQAKDDVAAEKPARKGW